MYNNQRYGRKQYNNIIAQRSQLSNDRLSYNGFSLHNNTTIVTNALSIEELNSRISAENKPQGNGKIFNKYHIETKPIPLTGTLIADTPGKLDDLLREFRKQIYSPQGNFDFITENGERIRYVVSLDNASFSRRDSKHRSVSTFDLDFECVSPFGFYLDPDTFSTSSITTLVQTGVLLNNGNVPNFAHDQYFDTILQFTAANTITKVNFKNTTNNDEIEITANISAGSTLRINGRNNSVALNGVEVDFSGTWPSANLGANQYTITVTATSATYNLTINSYKNSL